MLLCFVFLSIKLFALCYLYICVTGILAAIELNWIEFDMLFLKSVIVSSNNIKVWSCNSFFQFWLVMHYLSEMTEEQTLVMCSGHPQGLFPSSPSAPRAIISNGMVIHISSASVSDTLKKRHYCVISWVCYLVLLCSLRKNPYSPHRRGWKFVGSAGFSKAPNLSKCMKLDWNFQRGGGSLPWGRYE